MRVRKKIFAFPKIENVLIRITLKSIDVLSVLINNVNSIKAASNPSLQPTAMIYRSLVLQNVLESLRWHGNCSGSDDVETEGLFCVNTACGATELSPLLASCADMFAKAPLSKTRSPSAKPWHIDFNPRYALIFAYLFVCLDIHTSRYIR